MSSGGYELIYVHTPVDESDAWRVRLDLIDQSGVATRSLTGDAQVIEFDGCGDCRRAELTVTSDGGSLTQTAVP
jgi:hypothetical protein